MHPELTLCRQRWAHCCPVRPLIFLATADHLQARQSAHFRTQVRVGKSAAHAPVAILALPVGQQLVFLHRPGARLDGLAVDMTWHRHDWHRQCSIIGAAYSCVFLWGMAHTCASSKGCLGGCRVLMSCSGVGGRAASFEGTVA